MSRREAGIKDDETRKSKLYLCGIKKNSNFAPILRNRWQDVEFPVYVARNINLIDSIQMADLMKIAEEAFKTEKKEYPAFKSGDTISVAYKIIEGNKERIQIYRGVVIKIAGHGDSKRFTVRKMSGTVGVERIFPMGSPNIDSVTVEKRGKVRRAKLYYLRALTGKKARIKERKFVKAEA